MTYLIGLDIGTSAIKGVLISSEGKIVLREQSKTQIEILKDGQMQFDADDLYRLVTTVIKGLIQLLPAGASVAGISISSASGNTLLVDQEGKPMTPVFSWMDTRVKDEIATVFGKLDEEEVHRLIGWPLLNTFPLAHLSWLKCHQPQLLQQAARVCMSTDYILYRLTGKWGIDSSTATTFYLQDQSSSSWHLPYLQQLGIDIEKLPVIHKPGKKLGQILPEAAKETGLSTKAAVILGSFDHPSAARGAGVLDAGQLLLSCGTSWVGFYPLLERETAIGQKLLTDPFLQPEGAWGGMFSLPAIAAPVDKFVCQYISDASDRNEQFSKLAAAADAGAGGLMIHPLLECDNSALEGRDPAHIARALMEGTAYLLRMKLEQLQHAGLPAHTITMVGGPSETFPWPQIVADVISNELHIVNGSCAGAVGSAILAGIGIGLYKDERDAWQRAAFDRTTRTPNKEVTQKYEELYRKFLAKYN